MARYIELSASSSNSKAHLLSTSAINLTWIIDLGVTYHMIGMHPLLILGMFMLLRGQQPKLRAKDPLVFPRIAIVISFTHTSVFA